jgi:hypothetical protein
VQLYEAGLTIRQVVEHVGYWFGTIQRVRNANGFKRASALYRETGCAGWAIISRVWQHTGNIAPTTTTGGSVWVSSGWMASSYSPAHGTGAARLCAGDALQAADRAGGLTDDPLPRSAAHQCDAVSEAVAASQDRAQATNIASTLNHLAHRTRVMQWAAADPREAGFREVG